MAILKVQSSCEIDNLIEVVAERTGKDYEECEEEAFKSYTYPEGTKTCMSLEHSTTNNSFFREEIVKILREMGIERIYITEAI